MSRRHRVSWGSSMSRILLSFGLSAFVWGRAMSQAVSSLTKRSLVTIAKAPSVTTSNFTRP